MVKLWVLLVEDDPADMRQLLRDLPETIDEVKLFYDDTQDFDEAHKRVELRRYDLVVSDTYRGHVEKNDVSASMELVERYRKGRFCPILLISSGTRPADYQVGPFLRWADKSNLDSIKKEIEDLLETGIPQFAKQLHEDLDRLAGSHLWEFIESRWEELRRLEGKVLHRLIRRRAALQLAELNVDQGQPGFVEHVEGGEYYLYPALEEEDLRLGEILRKDGEDHLHVVLTPHCHLAVQEGSAEPRADTVLLAKTVPYRQVVSFSEFGKRSGKWPAKVRRATQAPPDFVRGPHGRYWFLPGFLDIPDCYCDFMRLESVDINEFTGTDSEYRRIAVLSPPFAESLQSCFTAFYASIGLPSLNTASMPQLLPDADDD